MVVGSTTVAPGERGALRVSVIMQKGMGGPHLFHIFVRSSDPEKPITVLKVKADIVSLEKWRRSHPDAFYLPRELAQFKLLSETEGILAEGQAHRIFGFDKALENAYLGQYRNAKKVTYLLVGEYGDAKKAEAGFTRFLARMGLSIRTDYVFKRVELTDKNVYLLKRGKREQYYFQNAHHIVWLSPDSSAVKETLLEVLKFFDIL